MSKLEERIAAAEQRLKTLKARQVRAATRQRTRDAKQQRRDDLRRKVLVGSVVLGMVERGEIEVSQLERWLRGALSRKEDLELFSGYWDIPKESGAENPPEEGDSELPVSNAESRRAGREIQPGR